MQNAPVGAFCKTIDLHLAIIGLKNLFLSSFLSGRLRQVLLYLFTENNTTGEKVCSSFVRVSKKPTSEELNYGLCEKGKFLRKLS